MRQRSVRLETYLLSLLLLALTSYFLMQVWFAREWRMVHDAPILHYEAFIFDRFGLAPYRDTFTFTFPGTILFHLAVGKMLGYSDAAFRWVDFGWLAALLALTGAALGISRFGRRAAWAGVTLFGAAYLHHGAWMSMQRDYIGLLPIATGLLLALAGRPAHRSWRRILIGLCFGLAASIKPQLALGLPVVAIYDLMENKEEGRSAATWLLSGFQFAAGLALPLAAVLFWVWRLDGWPGFWRATHDYLPLYLSMTGDHRVVSGVNRVLYLAQSYGQLGGLGLWLAPALLGVYRGLFVIDSTLTEKRQTLLLAALALVYSIYPVLSGQFWSYHWIPFQYFIVLTAGLTARPDSAAAPFGRRLFPVLVLAFAIVLAFSPTNEFARQWWGQAPLAPKDGRVDAIAGYLRQHLQPGDTVQPLDWTGGAVHAMLLAEARLATPFAYDFFFYHHVSNPTIQDLRRRFIQAMQSAPPRFIIAMQARPYPSGPDTSQDFPELDRLLADDYTTVVTTDDYLIYEYITP